jgi:hypothetical protein
MGEEFQFSAFFGGETAPDPMLFTDLDGMVPAHLQNGAFKANLLGPLFPTPFIGTAFKPCRWKENGLIRSTTR